MRISIELSKEAVDYFNKKRLSEADAYIKRKGGKATLEEAEEDGMGHTSTLAKYLAYYSQDDLERWAQYELEQERALPEIMKRNEENKKKYGHAWMYLSDERKAEIDRGVSNES